MKPAIFRKAILFSLLTLTNLLNAQKANNTAVVAVKPSVILRLGPTAKSKSLGSFPLGTEVKILNEESGTETILGLTGHWVKVEVNNSTGYIFGPLLKSATEKHYLEIVSGKAQKFDEGDNQVSKIKNHLPLKNLSECKVDRPEVLRIALPTWKANKTISGGEPFSVYVEDPSISCISTIGCQGQRFNRVVVLFQSRYIQDGISHAYYDQRNDGRFDFSEPDGHGSGNSTSFRQEINRLRSKVKNKECVDP